MDDSRNSNIPATFRSGVGTISRIRLENFMCHDNLQVELDQWVNFITGRNGIDQSKGMLGTFAPQREPYVHTLEEDTAPSGVLARGTYSAKLKFDDDDRRCHMELKYSFEIKKRS